MGKRQSSALSRKLLIVEAGASQMSGRGSDGRWSSRWRTWELPELVRQVAGSVVPEQPWLLGARQYDRERVAVGFVDAPSASAIRARLRVPAWNTLLVTIFSDTADIYQEIHRWREGVVHGRFTDRDVVGAVRAVAAFLGKRTLRPSEYAEGRRELLQRGHAGRLPLPTLNQLRYYGVGEWARRGTWDRLLERAGLDPASSGPRFRGLTVPEALDACVSAHGTLPTLGELRRFARANGLAMVDGNAGRLGAPERAELQRRRVARGLSTPTTPPAPAQRPDYDTPVPAERIPVELRAFRRRHRHSPESVRAMMHAFLDQLPDQLTPVAWLYRDFAAHTESVPNLVTLDRHFHGFASVRDAALTERVTRRRRPAGVQSAAAHPYKAQSVTPTTAALPQQTHDDPARSDF